MNDESKAMTNPNGAAAAAGMVQRQEFGASEMQRTGETSMAAAAEQARALVEARFIVAMRHPRDLDDVRLRILKEIQRPLMAQTAIYRKPVGGGFVEGPSVRFVEMALRNMRNVSQDSATIFDDAQRRTVRVTVSDNETNVSFSTDASIDKTVERKDPNGRLVLSSRTNSTNETTYTVVATDDELLMKQNAIVSKALRNNGLRIIPGDIVEEASVIARKIRFDTDARDPDAERKRLADAFATVNVMASHLKTYLGHDLGQSSPAEVEELRGVFTALRDGETSWAAILEAKNAERTKAAAGEKPSGAPIAETMRERVKAAAAKAKGPKPAETTPHDPATGEVVEPREPGSDDR